MSEESKKTVVFWDVLKSIHDIFLAKTLEIFDSGADVDPQLFIVETNDSGRIVYLSAVDPDSMMAMMRNDGTKNQFSNFIRSLFDNESDTRKSLMEQNFNPNILVQVNEAWLSNAGNNSAPFVKPSEDPQRKECVLLTLHTEFGSICVPHMIEREPKRRVVIEQFPEQSPNSFSTGRFSVPSKEGSDGRDKPLH